MPPADTNSFYAQGTLEALEWQPRIDALQRTTPPELGLAPATTAWRTVPHAGAAADTFAADSPGALISTLAAAHGWTGALGEAARELTIRVLPEGEDRAVGVVLPWGLLDDAVAGQDLRVTMERSDGDWHIHRVEQRFHCRRGAGEDNVCI